MATSSFGDNSRSTGLIVVQRVASRIPKLIPITYTKPFGINGKIQKAPAHAGKSIVKTFDAPILSESFPINGEAIAAIMAAVAITIAILWRSILYILSR